MNRPMSTRSRPNRKEPAGAGSGAEAAPEGPPGGTPYTVYFPEGEALQAADLAYPAPLPRVGDMVEYIDEVLVTHRYVVRQVVHTLQAEPRPRRAGDAGASTEPPPAELRAGLPEVFLDRLRSRRIRRR